MMVRRQGCGTIIVRKPWNFDFYAFPINWLTRLSDGIVFAIYWPRPASSARRSPFLGKTTTQEKSMASAVRDVFKPIKENEVKFVDLRFTDTKGKEQHVTVPVKAFGEDKFKDGHAFDGSSIAGWKGIEASDMLLMPDPSSAVIDPFFEEPTINLTCDVLEPADGKPYDRDPRSIAKKAEAYLKASGLGDTAYFGPE